MTPLVILVVFISSLAYILGGFLVLFKRRWSESGLMSLMSMSAGLLLAIALLDLIPDTLKDFQSGGFFVVIGFLIMYFISLLSRGKKTHMGSDKIEQNQNASTAMGLSLGMLLHNFFEGLSIGLSYTISVQLGVIVSIALVIHKIPEGLSYSSAMLSTTQDRQKTGLYLIGQALFTWLGAGGAFLIVDLKAIGPKIVAIALSITAGIFLYLSGTTLLPSINQKRFKALPFFFIGGIFLYVILHQIAETLS